MLKFSVTAAVVVSLVAASAPADPPANPPAPVLLSADYRILATAIARPMSLGEPVVAAPKKSVSEMIARAQATLMDLRQIHSGDEGITQVAGIGIEAVDDLTKQIEAIDVSRMSRPVGGQASPEVLVDLVVGAAEPALLIHAIGEVAQLQQKQNAANAAWKQALQDETAHVVSDSHKLEAAALLLPKVAAKYCAPIGPNDAKFEVMFIQAWGPLPFDMLMLKNPGPDLDDCTITVEIAGAKGDTRTNVHFVPTWKKNTQLAAPYTMGEPVLGEVMNRSTVMNAKIVTVTIQSPKYSTRLAYATDPKVQDQAVAVLCSHLTFAGTVTQNKHLLSPDTYTLAVTLDGMPFIPKNRVTLTLHQGKQSNSFAYNFDSWKKGETKTFSLLPYNPDKTEISIAFPDCNFVYKAEIGK